MLNENIRILRKQKGLSQEELAIRLNVVRQTVSKWEKGLSVPDAELLIKISEVFETTVGELLGTKIPEENAKDEIVEQLVRLNEQLAIRNRRTKTIMKIVLGIIGGIIALQILLIVFSYFLGVVTDGNTSTETNSEIVVKNSISRKRQLSLGNWPYTLRRHQRQPRNRILVN